MDDAEFDRALAAVAADRKSGAGALARQCLAILVACAETAPAATAADLTGLLRDRAAALAAARPSMAPVANLMMLWRGALSEINAQAGGDLAVLRAAAAGRAREITADSEAATGRAADIASDYLRDRLNGAVDPVILTLSWSAVVAHALAGLADTGAAVWVAESRPLNEGARLAEFLAGQGCAVTVITDAQVAQAARAATVGICGADALFLDGTLVNKTGTLPLALALKDAGRPLAAACESFKGAPGAVESWPFEIMDGGELGYGASSPFAVRNVYFEAVPARLIGVWITENGVARNSAELAHLNPAFPAPSE